MKTTNLFNSKIASALLKTVAVGGSSVLLMQFMSFSVPQTANSPFPAINLGGEKAVATTPSAVNIQYVAPSRGAAFRTVGTGARGGYNAPDRGAAFRTVGTGARGGYFAPDRGSAQRTIGTGARGEGSDYLPVTLSLLIPNDHTGRTTSAHPTFFWHMTATPNDPVEFALVEPGVAKPIFVQRIATPTVGVNQVAMPSNLPELIPGHKYRWSVSLIRNDKRRSTDVFVQGWVERVATTPELDSKLAAATSDRERAGIYAEKGIWYNALESISAAQAAAPNDKAIAVERISLLEQVGQKQVAEQERQRLAI